MSTPAATALAALPAALANLPRDQWVSDHDGPVFINSATGAYALVAPDTEDTGHWFIDVTLADGRYLDHCLDSREWAMQAAEEMTWSK